ncbi:MAG TPA: metalloregulator ArsR/SmtB family transcription factor [Gemmatimonadaceae bacterium]|jgi:ArsR family transcriptional regulator
MADLTMSPELVELVADRFKALGDPARLRILSALRGGERAVTELVEQTGLTQANVSKHLALLLRLGFVRRRRSGAYTYYALADRGIFRLCDLMCGRIENDVEKQQRLMLRR